MSDPTSLPNFPPPADEHPLRGRVLDVLKDLGLSPNIDGDGDVAFTIGEPAAFLQDGMDVVMELYNEKPISVQLPDQIEATIVEADAVVKGQTASSSYKPAILDNGVRVMVPPHISSGTRIVVDVYEQTYVRRAD